MKIKPIYFVLPLAMLSMLMGVYAGWLRLGWDFVIVEPAATAQHGVLMVGCFLGTLIATERVAVLKNKGWWWWAIPLVFVSSLPLMMHLSPQTGYVALVLGSIGYVIISIRAYQTYQLTGDALLLVGAIFQLFGHLAFSITFSFPIAFAAWMAFFVFTIVGERLNLTRFSPVTSRNRWELFMWLGGFIASLFFYHEGYGIVLTITLVGIGQWLVRNDIARHNLNKTGSYRFLGMTLLTGYGWLMLTGLVAVLNNGSPWLYDAVLHCFFVGFVLSMIMAHAPIIFPSLVGINAKPYHPFMYVWIGTMQVSLLMRIVGDLSQNLSLRKWGGLFNGLAFLGYLITVIILIKSQVKAVSVKNKSLLRK